MAGGRLGCVQGSKAHFLLLPLEALQLVLLNHLLDGSLRERGYVSERVCYMLCVCTCVRVCVYVCALEYVNFVLVSIHEPPDRSLQAFTRLAWAKALVCCICVKMEFVCETAKGY